MFWTFLESSPASAGQVTIGGPQGHHLARVLRVRPGEHGVVVSDGVENEVEVTGVEGSLVRARVLASHAVRGEPAISITVLQAALPNPDFDAVIEGGTEVGVTRFVAIQASRSVARPDARRLARWRSIAGSAAEQSHRGAVPEVIGPVSLKEAVDRYIDGSRLIVLDPRSSKSLRQAIDGSRSYWLAVGPEGGWTGDELALLDHAGAVAVNLGPRILRARLAPIVAAAILVQQS